MVAFLWEFFLFGMKQARACLFAGLFLSLLLLSHHIPLFGLARYDFLFLAVLGVQALLLALRLETREEALVLCAFHLLGLLLELFKTHPAIGSWSYPEEGYFKIGTVPLYSGFMYAAVASYMCQAWHHLRLELRDYPSAWWTAPLALAVYANFFTRHFVPDVRFLLILAIVCVFRRTHVHFTVWRQRRTMPLVLSFVLIGFFVWVAENASTYLGAWVYPEQKTGWRVVSLWIISSWVLLVIVSFILVADLKHVRRWTLRGTDETVRTWQRSMPVQLFGSGIAQQDTRPESIEPLQAEGVPFPLSRPSVSQESACRRHR
jgi:uncharacterized membrane protein YoaT (DUF817 family)